MGVDDAGLEPKRLLEVVAAGAVPVVDAPNKGLAAPVVPDPVVLGNKVDPPVCVVEAAF